MTLKLCFILALSLCSISSTYAKLIDLRDYRLPSKQSQLLDALGLGDISLETESASEVERTIEEEGTRRVIYLPYSPRELMVVLDMLLTLAKENSGNQSSTSFWDFAQWHQPHSNTFDASHKPDDRLIATMERIDRKFPGREEHSVRVLDLNLAALLTEYSAQISLIEKEHDSWFNAWEDSLGLSFELRQGRLELYFPIRFSGMTQPGLGVEEALLVDTQKKEPIIIFSEIYDSHEQRLHTADMLHALARPDAPKWDGLWIFNDAQLKLPGKVGQFSNFQRVRNQVNDYVQQTLRHEDQLRANDDLRDFYQKMWSFVNEHSSPSLPEQLASFDAEFENIPFLNESISDLDKPIFEGHPFSFKELSMLSAYGNFELPLGVTSDFKRPVGPWLSVVAIQGGSVSFVPDGLWDGRFLLFPHEHAHMLNFGTLGNNNGGINPFKAYNPLRPDSATHPIQARFRDGAHCAYAKDGNCWRIRTHSSPSGLDFNIDHVSMLAKSAWEAPGRFFYKKSGNGRQSQTKESDTINTDLKNEQIINKGHSKMKIGAGTAAATFVVGGAILHNKDNPINTEKNEENINNRHRKWKIGVGIAAATVVVGGVILYNINKE